jgi:purine-binding chemotaxis protein CheW
LSPPGGPSVPTLIVRAGGQTCALPVRSVVETLRPGAIAPIPGAPAFVRGVMAIRGAPVPVVDLASLLGRGSSANGARLVVARAGERRVALWVDAVVGISPHQPAQLDELPPLLAEIRAELVEKIGMLDSELLLVLRASRLLPPGALEGLELPEGSA